MGTNIENVRSILARCYVKLAEVDYELSEWWKSLQLKK